MRLKLRSCGVFFVVTRGVALKITLLATSQPNIFLSLGGQVMVVSDQDAGPL